MRIVVTGAGPNGFLGNHVKKAFDDEKIKDYKDVRCNNQKLLFSSKEMQQKVFLQGI